MDLIHSIEQNMLFALTPLIVFFGVTAICLGGITFVLERLIDALPLRIMGNELVMWTGSILSACISIGLGFSAAWIMLGLLIGQLRF